MLFPFYFPIYCPNCFPIYFPIYFHVFSHLFPYLFPYFPLFSFPMFSLLLPYYFLSLLCPFHFPICNFLFSLLFPFFLTFFLFSLHDLTIFPYYFRMIFYFPSEQRRQQPFMCIRKSKRGTAWGGRGTNLKSYSLTWSNIVDTIQKLKGFESRDLLTCSIW